MSEQWVLVPVEPTDGMAIVCAPYDQTALSFYRAMLSARPPIPRKTWDAMVEAGAKAIYAAECCQSDQWPAFLVTADAALRTLGNPEIADE